MAGNEVQTHMLTLFFVPEFGDPLWAGIDYELVAPEQERGEWVLGRSPTAQLTLNLRTISAKHAVISYSYANNSWLISDLGSENGTYLNGQRVAPPRRPQPLAIGDRIDLGPRARIQVVENDQDTTPEEMGPPTVASTTPIEILPPAPAPAPVPAPEPQPQPQPRTYADSIYLGLQWILTPTTKLGVGVRLVVLAVAALVLVLVED